MLWSESMGHCMNPQCHRDVFQEGASIGELAHIQAHADGGDTSFDNLLVLCRNCHKTIDENPQHWPRDVLRQWKSDRNSDLTRWFTKRFRSFDDLESVVVPLLKRNGQIFDSYGPIGDPSVDVKRHELWVRFEGELIANNKRLEHILTSNKQLLHRDNQTIVDDFMGHAREFVETREGAPVSRVNLFPSALNSVFGIERIDGEPYEHLSALENYITQLVREDRFVQLELVPNQILTYREDDKLQELQLSDYPRLRQIYWNGHFYTPQNTKVRYGSLKFILRWLWERSIDYVWHDPTRLTEITVAKKYIIKFVYAYSLSDIDMYEVADRKNLILVNLHSWADNEVDVQKTKEVSEVGVHVLRQSEFFRFAYDNLV